MCIAIVKLPTGKITDDQLRSSWISNPDGAGFAYLKDGKIEVSKGYLKLEPFLTELKKAIEENQEATFLIHCRIRSMGEKGATNTHPFTYKHGAMIHNGTLSGTNAKSNEGPSDTALFLQQFGDKLTYDVVLKQRAELEEAIGSWNKLAFLFNDGKHLILNQDKGEWNDGVWYSNTTYKRSISRITGPWSQKDVDDAWDDYHSTLNWVN